jgi:hypothetical protein
MLMPLETLHEAKGYKELENKLIYFMKCSNFTVEQVYEVLNLLSEYYYENQEILEKETLRLMKERN